MKQKRPRGRPPGTGKNDAPYLDQVADLMLANPELKKTPAIATIVAKNFPDAVHPPSEERRLLYKWNKTAEERMAAARERRAEARKPATRIITPLTNFPLGELAATFSSPIGLQAQKIGKAFEKIENLNGKLSPDLVAQFDTMTRNSIQVGKILERNKEFQAVLSLTNQPDMRRILEQNERIQMVLSRITRQHTG